jgi:hypothetical protein
VKGHYNEVARSTMASTQPPQSVASAEAMPAAVGGKDQTNLLAMMAGYHAACAKAARQGHHRSVLDGIRLNDQNALALAEGGQTARAPSRAKATHCPCIQAEIRLSLSSYPSGVSVPKR